MDLTVASWNLCGLSKLLRWPSVFQWLESRDIVLIQESLQTKAVFNFNDVTRFDVPAVASGGRARGGLIVMLRNNVFGNSRVRVILDEEFLLVVEVSTALQTLIIANVYAPVFSPGNSPEVINTISLQLGVLCDQFPSTPMVIAGKLVLRPSTCSYVLNYSTSIRFNWLSNVYAILPPPQVTSMVICSPPLPHVLMFFFGRWMLR